MYSKTLALVAEVIVGALTDTIFVSVILVIGVVIGLSIA